MEVQSPNAPLASMTGFARANGAQNGWSWTIEIKTVNARGLDIRMRLGHQFDQLDPLIRKQVSSQIKRGSVNISLNASRDAATAKYQINEQTLGEVLDAMDALAGKIDADRPRLDGILSIKGVMEQREAGEGDVDTAVGAAILETLNGAIAELLETRQAEGAQLYTMIETRLAEIDTCTRLADNHPARTQEAIQDRLQAQIAKITGADGSIDEGRIAQEVALLATKADIREELDRLYAHVAATRDLIAQGGPVGRKLDFLAQEFNREANTLCSKSNDVSLTAIGLDLKVSIDQLREQIQNLE